MGRPLTPPSLSFMYLAHALWASTTSGDGNTVDVTSTIEPILIGSPVAFLPVDWVPAFVADGFLSLLLFPHAAAARERARIRATSVVDLERVMDFNASPLECGSDGVKAKAGAGVLCPLA